MMRPFGHRVLFVRPFAMGGRKGKIILNHDDRLYKIYGEVLAVHPTCRHVRVGDFVVYMPNRPVKLRRPDGPVWALREMQVLGIVQHPDGEPWFNGQQDKQEPASEATILPA